MWYSLYACRLSLRCSSSGEEEASTQIRCCLVSQFLIFLHLCFEVGGRYMTLRVAAFFLCTHECLSQALSYIVVEAGQGCSLLLEGRRDA